MSDYQGLMMTVALPRKEPTMGLRKQSRGLGPLLAAVSEASQARVQDANDRIPVLQNAIADASVTATVEARKVAAIQTAFDTLSEGGVL